MVNGFRLGGSLALLVAVALPSRGSERLEPPSLVLTAPENRVAVVRVVDVEGGRAIVVPVAELHGETASELRVRIDRETLGRIEIGGKYVLGYTLLREDPRERSRDYEIDPAGPRIVDVPAVGPALFEDSAAVRRLVEAVEATEEPEARILLGAVVEQAGRPDAPSRLLVLTELVLRPELTRAATATDLGVFRRLLEEGALAPQAKELLLRALAPRAGGGELGWLRSVCLGIVSAHDRRLDLASSVPALLETALGVLAEVGRPEDAVSLAEHLHSNNPGVGLAALAAMRRLDAGAASRAASEALRKGDVHGDVAGRIERFLDDTD